MDFVGRYERLDADFAHICHHVGISAVLPRHNASRHGRYTANYTAWGKGFVAERYADDIRAFGYCFAAVP